MGESASNVTVKATSPRRKPVVRFRRANSFASCSSDRRTNADDGGDDCCSSGALSSSDNNASCCECTCGAAAAAASHDEPASDLASPEEPKKISAGCTCRRDAGTKRSSSRTMKGSFWRGLSSRDKASSTRTEATFFGADSEMNDGQDNGDDECSVTSFTTDPAVSPMAGSKKKLGIKLDRTITAVKITEENEGAGGEDSDSDDGRDCDASDDISKDTAAGKLAKAFSDFRRVCGKVVNYPPLQTVIVIFILINSIMMGIETFDFVEDDPVIRRAFDMCDMIFLIIFTVEIGLQAVCYGLSLFRDAWLTFDLIIVVVSWSVAPLQVVRAFRIFRSLRLVTRLKAMRELVEALFAVAPSVSAILALLVLVLYIYGVLVTELFRDLHDLGVTEEDYFGRLEKSLFTLVEIMTLEWAGLAREVFEEYPMSALVFVAFSIKTSFILYSLVIAVICDAVRVNNRRGGFDDGPSRRKVAELQRRLNRLTASQNSALEAVALSLDHLENMRRRKRKTKGPVVAAGGGTASRKQTRSKRLLRSDSEESDYAELTKKISSCVSSHSGVNVTCDDDGIHISFDEDAP